MFLYVLCPAGQNYYTSHSGPVETFIPEPQSLAFAYCRIALLSIVLLWTGRWVKRLTIRKLNTAPNQWYMSFRRSRLAQLRLFEHCWTDTSGCFRTEYVCRMSDFGNDPYVRDTAYKGANFFEVGNQKGMSHILTSVQQMSRLFPCPANALSAWHRA